MESKFNENENRRTWLYVTWKPEKHFITVQPSRRHGKLSPFVYMFEFNRVFYKQVKVLKHIQGQLKVWMHPVTFLVGFRSRYYNITTVFIIH